MVYLYITLMLIYTYAAEPDCLKETQVRARVCQALCKHDGFDVGSYRPKTGSCVCGTEKDFKEYTEELKIIPPVDTYLVW